MSSHLSFQCFCPDGTVHAFMQGALWGNPTARVPLTASPTGHETLISPSASPGGHLLLFFQMVSCQGDKAQRLSLQLSCILRPPKT